MTIIFFEVLFISNCYVYNFKCLVEVEVGGVRQCQRIECLFIKNLLGCRGGHVGGIFAHFLRNFENFFKNFVDFWEIFQNFE